MMKIKKYKAKKKFHWWIIPILLVAVVVAAVVSVYAYVNAHIHQTTKVVSTWSQADSATHVSVSSAQASLKEIDEGNFPSGNFSNYPIIKVKQIDPDIENVLLVGVDNATQGNRPEGSFGANRADCIMVLSINHKTNALKMISLMRDTKTFFPNTKSNHKLNAAFSYGGIGLQIDVVNYAYKLDIQKYAQFDFDGFTHIIDTVGGAPLKMSAVEAGYVGVGTQAGTYELDGAHALRYARTRYIDTDFMRTQRQRNIMLAIYEKYKTTGILTKLTVLNQCLGYFKTNIPTTELTGKLLQFENDLKDIRQTTIPKEDDGLYTTEKSPIWFWDINWAAEDAKLHSFIYGN